jgi:hypothetical protein
MQKIRDLDAELTRVFADFEALAATLEFQEICELVDVETVTQQHYPGIYRIDIHTGAAHTSFETWYEWFRREWVTEEYERKHVPNPKKKRVVAHMTKPLPQWMPLYLGKSRDIAGRVLGHIDLKLNQPTTALKLKERRNMAGQRFRLSTLRIEVENYDLIMPQVESALRDHCNPILGRQ